MGAYLLYPFSSYVYPLSYRLAGVSLADTADNRVKFKTMQA